MTPVDRQTGLGASEVPSILGQSPWRTPVAVWLDKVGLGQGQRDTMALRVGRSLERTILRLAADMRRERLTHNATTFRHPAWPRVPLFATPDGFTRGRRGLAEVKVVGHRWADWTDGPPPYVVTQVQAQMAVLPRATSALVIALQGAEVKTWEVARDQGLIDALVLDVMAWWSRYVVLEAAPPPETDDDRWEVVRYLAAREPTRTARLAAEEEARVAGRLADTLDVIHAAQVMADADRLWLAEAAAGQDLTGTGWTGTWTTRRTVDWRSLVEALPGTIPQYLVDAATREAQTFTFRRKAAQEAVA